MIKLLNVLMIRFLINSKYVPLSLVEQQKKVVKIQDKKIFFSGIINSTSAFDKDLN